MKLFSSHRAEKSTGAQCCIRYFELAFWIALLAGINLPLLSGAPPTAFIFDLQLVKMGQVWRIVTFPFAHVSTYHLFMDAAAFLLLYNGLEERSALRRVMFTAACALGSLLLPLLLSKTVRAIGLSGLSGTAHGLTAVASLELIRNNVKESPLFKIGVAVLIAVTLKSIVEVSTGNVIFSSLHLGSVGTPVVESHLGGVIGGAVSFILLNRHKPMPASAIETP